MSTRRLPRDLQDSLKGVENKEVCATLVTTWETGGKLAAAIKLSQQPSSELRTFVSGQLRVKMFAEHPVVVAMVVDQIMGNFSVTRWPAMTKQYLTLREKTESSAQPLSSKLQEDYDSCLEDFKHWAEVICGCVATLHTTLESAKLGDQMKLADLLSRPAIECLGSTIAGWPLDALGVRSLEMVTEFLCLLVRLSGSIKLQLQTSKTYGYCPLGTALFKSTNVILSLSLLELITAVLPEQPRERALAAKEVFISKRWQSKDAKVLQAELLGAVKGKYKKHSTNMLRHIATLGSHHPQPHTLLALSRDGLEILSPRGASDVGEFIWVDPSSMIARIPEVENNQAIIAEHVYLYASVSNFRVHKMCKEGTTYKFGYEGEDERPGSIELKVPPSSKFADEVKARVYRLGLDRFFYMDYPNIPIRVKASRTSEPATVTAPIAAARHPRKTEPVTSFTELRQAEQKQMIDEDGSSERVASSSPLSSLPPEAEKTPTALAKPSTKKRERETPQDAFVHDKEVEDAGCLTENPKVKKTRQSAKVDTAEIPTLIAQHSKPLRRVKVQQPPTKRQADVLAPASAAIPSVAGSSTRMSAALLHERCDIKMGAVKDVEVAQIWKLKDTNGFVQSPPVSRPAKTPSKRYGTSGMQRQADIEKATDDLKMDADSEDERIQRGMLGFPRLEGDSQPTPSSRSPPDSSLSPRLPAQKPAIPNASTKAKPQTGQTGTSPKSAASATNTAQAIARPSYQNSKAVQAKHPEQFPTPIQSWDLNEAFGDPEKLKVSQLQAEQADSAASAALSETKVEAHEVRSQPPINLQEKDEQGSERQSSYEPEHRIKRPRMTNKATIYDAEVKFPKTALIAVPQSTKRNAKFKLKKPLDLSAQTKIKAMSISQNQQSSQQVIGIQSTTNSTAILVAVKQVNLAMSEHFATIVNDMETRSKMASSLMVQEARDLLEDVSERSDADIQTLMKTDLRGSREEALLHILRECTLDVGIETTKTVDSGKRRVWVWPDLRF